MSGVVLNGLRKEINAFVGAFLLILNEPYVIEGFRMSGVVLRNILKMIQGFIVGPVIAVCYSFFDMFVSLLCHSVECADKKDQK